jgi:hypothetical protein
MKTMKVLVPFVLILASVTLLATCGGGGGGGVVPVIPKAWHHPASLVDNISPDSSSASNPQAAMDNSGNTIVAWVQSDGANNQIYKSEYRNGLWTHPTTSADHVSPAGFAADYPSVAMDNNGNALVVWRQFDDSFACAGDCPSAYKSEFRNGAWSAPSSAGDLGVTNPYAFPPHASMDDNGNALIVWSQYTDGVNDGIFMSKYGNGVWTRPTSTTDHINPAGRSDKNPQVAMDNHGNAIIVWQQYDGAFTQIYKSEYRGGGWTHPTNLATDHISPDGQNAYSPQVAMDDLGNAVIVWTQNYATTVGCGSMGTPGPCSAVFMSEYRSSVWSSPTSTTQHISPSATDATAGSPTVAMDGSGNAIITWAQSNNLSQCAIGPAIFDRCFNIFKSEYRNSVWTHPTSTTQFINPSGTGITASAPQVRMDRKGDAIIAWSGYDSNTAECFGVMPCSQVFKSEYRNNAWMHPAGLTDNISPDGQPVGWVGLAMGNNGDAVIVWPEADGISSPTRYLIFKSEYR